MSLLRLTYVIPETEKTWKIIKFYSCWKFAFKLKVVHEDFFNYTYHSCLNQHKHYSTDDANIRFFHVLLITKGHSARTCSITMAWVQLHGCRLKPLIISPPTNKYKHHNNNIYLWTNGCIFICDPRCHINVFINGCENQTYG